MSFKKLWLNKSSHRVSLNKSYGKDKDITLVSILNDINYIRFNCVNSIKIKQADDGGCNQSINYLSYMVLKNVAFNNSSRLLIFNFNIVSKRV